MTCSAGPVWTNSMVGSLTGGSATHIVQHLDCGTGQDKY